MPKGKCECGKVRFEVEQLRPSVTVCHCRQCRRTSGHVWASTHAPMDKLRLFEQSGLTWYESSPTARRGFCKYCGASLFFRMNGEEGIGIAAGCLDLPTGLKLAKHIFTADQGDYYEIGDDLPHFLQSGS